MDTIKERLDLLFGLLFKTKTEASQVLGFTKAYVSNITTGEKGVSGEVLLRISERIPLANIDWLFHGRGPMLFDAYTMPSDGTEMLSLGIAHQKDQPRAAAEDPVRYAAGDGEQRLAALLEFNQMQMQELRREIDFLKVQMAKRERGGK